MSFSNLSTDFIIVTAKAGYHGYMEFWAQNPITGTILFMVITAFILAVVDVSIR